MTRKPRLKPFFGYFGSKWRLAPKYPEPRYDTIIEPFAGSAGYSLFHHEDHDVILNDKNEAIAGIWDYLIHATPEEIEALPDKLSDDLTPAQQALIGFWYAKASATPRRTLTPWAKDHPDSTWWGLEIKRRIARQLPAIKNWKIVKGDYRSLENVEATWFVDPPYQHHGSMYPHGSRGFDYTALAEWCRSRRGQVIVCEGEGAEWLPFRLFKPGKRSTGTKAAQGAGEFVWLSDATPPSSNRFEAEMAEHPQGEKVGVCGENAGSGYIGIGIMDTFDERLLQYLAERGVTIGSDGLFVRIPGFTGPNQPTDAQLRFLNERLPNQDTNGRLKTYWVNDLAEMVEALSAQGDAAPWPFRTAFWLRLHGVISELRNECLERFRKLELDPNTYVPKPGSPLALEIEKFRCIEAVRQQFSEDELIYADYLRQTNGHPTQESYAVRWSNANGGQVNDRRRISTIGREFTVAELDDAIRRVLFANLVAGQINENAIATAFARRIRPLMGPLVEVMRRMITPT